MSSSIDLAKSCDLITINRRTNKLTPGYYPLLAWKCMIHTCTTSTYNNRSWKIHFASQDLEPALLAGGGGGGGVAKDHSCLDGAVQSSRTSDSSGLLVSTPSSSGAPCLRSRERSTAPRLGLRMGKKAISYAAQLSKIAPAVTSSVPHNPNSTSFFTIVAACGEFLVPSACSVSRKDQ